MVNRRFISRTKEPRKTIPDCPSPVDRYNHVLYRTPSLMDRGQKSTIDILYLPIRYAIPLLPMISIQRSISLVNTSIPSSITCVRGLFTFARR